jgi:2-iminobutanoate/2-iminopropanoate deaminase
MSDPVGPYSPTARAGNLLVCSGQIGARSGPDGPALVPGGFRAQVRQALDNVAGLLAAQGLDWGHVAKTTVYLADIADFGAFNEIYVEALGSHRPARSVVAVAGLPMGALVEIEVWANVRTGST